MSDSGFGFQKWENRLPYYALMKMDEDKLCALEVTWESAKKKGVRAALIAIQLVYNNIVPNINKIAIEKFL